jgi:peptidoglycan-N-acetylglucosamine deacetylase
LKFSASLFLIMSRTTFLSILAAAIVICCTGVAAALQSGFLSSSPSAHHPNAAAVPRSTPVSVVAQSTPVSALPKSTPVVAVAACSPTPSSPLNATNEPQSSYKFINVDGPYIAMTFDDGPDANLTPRLLDILKQRHIRATFFVLGKRVQDHPEILRREIAEGHEIGNHSWDHPPLNKLAEDGLHHQLADTSALLKQVSGRNPTLMRPPYGATNARLSRAIEKEYGMKVILWSVDPFDWKNPGPQVIQNRILNGWQDSSGAKPGAIILSHDIHKGTIEAMPATLDALLAKGYKFVTVSQLLSLESKTPPPTPTPTPATPKSAESDPKKKN